MDLKDFDSWNIYEGSSEGSGRSEKIWLSSLTDEIGVFKYPKANTNPVGEIELTSEHISESIASELANVLGIPCAKVDVGYRDGRIGSMSYQINKPGIELIEGIHFINRLYPDYDPDTKFSKEAQQYYSIQMVVDAFGVLRNPFIKQFFEMLVFDAFIGNKDRHQNNWAILVINFDNIDPQKIAARYCPLYDNGSSLCSYVQILQAKEYLNNDKNRFAALIDSKSKSRIRIDPAIKKEPSHSEVLTYLFSNHVKDVDQIVERIAKLINEDIVETIIERYPDEILTKAKKVLIKRFLLAKRELILRIFRKEGG